MSVTIQGSAGVTTNSGAVYNGLQTGTAVSASGTSVDFTSIPSWVKRITVMFNGVSTNGSSNVQIQLGSTTFTTSGYTGSVWGTSGTAIGNTNNSTGFFLRNGWSAALSCDGNVMLCNVSGNTWVESHTQGSSDGNNGGGGGKIALSGILDRVRITTVNGTDTFDNGTINIIYE